MLETIMAKMTKEQMLADWTTTKDIVCFQELLKEETDEGRYAILSQLLSEEFEQFKVEAPRPPQPDPKGAIDDFGNPLMGLFLGASMIAATMGGFFCGTIIRAAQTPRQPSR